MKKVLLGLLLALGLAFSNSGVALATPALPSTTSWSDAGLQEMVRFSGPISVSQSGAGFTTQTGQIQVEKPANSTVIAAYLTAAVTNSSTTPSGVTINSQAVSFTHTATATGGTAFTNWFADVTTQVKSTIDAASAGSLLLAIDEGTNPGTSRIDGQELVVVFDDPAKPASTVIIMFGASRSAGDSFSFSFPAITDLSAQIPTLSLGIGFSAQSGGNRTQSSTVQLSTSSNSALQYISKTAGDCEDGALANGALITVGGIGNSRDFPGSSTTANDDELYGLESFIALGDTSITLTTRNATGDDNLFQSVLYFEGVVVTGSVVVGSAPTVFVGPAPSSPAPSSPTPTITTQTSSAALADTGMNQIQLTSWGIFGIAIVGLGIGILISRKRILV